MVNMNFFLLSLKYLWSIYYVAVTILGTKDTSLNKRGKKSCFHRAYSFVVVETPLINQKI